MSRMPKTGNEQKSVKPTVRRLLDKYQWFWWGVPAGFGKSGISDTNAIKNGVFLAIESKFGANKATANQIGYLNSITAEHGFGFVVSEKTLPALETFLRNFGQAVQVARTGALPDVELGGPMLNAIAVLTDYPKDMDEYARQREARRRRAEGIGANDEMPGETSDGEGSDGEDSAEDDHDD